MNKMLYYFMHKVLYCATWFHLLVLCGTLCYIMFYAYGPIHFIVLFLQQDFLFIILLKRMITSFLPVSLFAFIL